jgi:Bacterial Ig-like domain (group 3)
LTTGGVQTQLNTLGASEGVAVDASQTVYATRYNGDFGVAELSPNNYSTANGFLDGADRTGMPLGLGLGSDGTLAVGVYQNMDIVDRTRGAFEFDNATTGATTSQIGDVRNIGNQSLTLAEISLTGNGYSLATGSGNCAGNTILAAAESCNIQVSFTPTHAGIMAGSVMIVSDSLAATTTQTIALLGKVSGAYLTASSVPVNFGSQKTGTSTSAQTVALTNNGLDYNARVTAITSSDPAFTVGTGNCESQDVALGGNCQMTVTFSPTAVVSYSANITVTYVSDGAQMPSATTIFKVTGTGTPAYSTKTTLASSLNPSVSGQSVTFTATVAANSGPTPTGTVTFTHGGILIGSAPLNAAGVATLASSSLPHGTAHVIAAYSGSATDGASTSPVLAQVVLASTKTTLASSLNPSVSGQSVTFTATVAANSGPTPTGTVTFTHGGILIGSAPLNAAGVATLASSSLPHGTAHVIAAYSGSATDGASSSPVLAQVVNP